MIFKFFADGGAPRPPLAGRLVGLAIGVLALSLAVYVALGVLEALVPLVISLLGVALVYRVMFGRAGQK